MTTDYTHPDYKKLAPIWKKVRDAVAGEDAIKAGGRTYLPDPSELTPDGARYDHYLRRAVYYNATGRTLAGLIGVAFSNWPQIKTTKSELLLDADGSGVGLVNQSQWMLSEVMQTGRGGLLADYTAMSPVRRVKTVADMEAAGWRSFVVPYDAESILTWELSSSTLTRLVLRESLEVNEGGEVSFVPQLRELVVEDGTCVVRIWQRHSNQGQFILARETDINLPFIPFAFVGATNNDAQPDQPPMLDLANLNIAHYRNSADFEESVFIMGQPQLWISGVSEDWKRETGTVTFGSRAAIVLPSDGKCGLLQVSPNTLAKQAMDDKERMMQALGALLLSQPSKAAKTATQTAAETKATYASLSLACDNVSDAYTKVLQWLESWGSARKSTASFAFDARFGDLAIDANGIMALVASWQAGLVPQSDAWGMLRQLGVIDQGKTDEQVAGEIEGQGAPLKLDQAA